MTVKRIFDLVKAGLITVKDPSKGFTVNDLKEEITVGYKGQKPSLCRLRLCCTISIHFSCFQKSFS